MTRSGRTVRFLSDESIPVDDNASNSYFLKRSRYFQA
jgi:hypothetical protein